MNTRSLSSIAVFVSLIMGVTLFAPGCDDDSNPVVTPGRTTFYGSGTITTTSSAGSLSITGTGVWPFQAGPSVIAMFDTTFDILFVYGYERVSGSHYNIAAVGAIMPGGVAVGTYNHPQMFLGVAYNIDTTYHADSLAYQAVSGSLTITVASDSSATGTYTAMARKGSAQPIQFTGTFIVKYGKGVMPDYDAAYISSFVRGDN